MEEQKQQDMEMDQEEEEPLFSSCELRLKECIEPLLHFTLTLSIQQSIHTDLSNQFCSNLLQHDDEHHHHLISSTSSPSDQFEGVPPYPLYKYLASALWKSISSGTVHRMHANPYLINEAPSLKQKEQEWNKIIVEKGSDLVKLLESVEFQLHVQEPFFSQLKDGKKTIEGRCAGGDFNCIAPGSLILFNKCLLLQVQGVHHYGSFSDMLATEDLTKVLPGVETVKEGIQIYRKFYSEEKEMSNGVLAIFLMKPASQLYDHLAAILAALHYDGIRRLLGMAQTVGTIPDALPLPRSTLLSSFSYPHNPDGFG